MLPPSREDDAVRAIERAITLITRALDLLDAHADCPVAAAHLDLALRCLRQRLVEIS